MFEMFYFLVGVMVIWVCSLCEVVICAFFLYTFSLNLKKMTYTLFMSIREMLTCIYIIMDP